MKLLIKLGGTLLDAEESRHRLAREITHAAEKAAVVVVHGGGKQMTKFLAERGIESRFVNGLRVTTPEVIDAVVKVFAGSVNAQLVTAFRAAGARPVGLSGLDAGLVDAEQLSAELGQVGRPVRSDPRLLELLTHEHFLPVVACVAGDAQGAIYNVNADQMAVACATGFGAAKLIFLTDVDGVRDGAGQTRSTLSSSEALGLIRQGVATGGMQAKLEAALLALEKGVEEVIIAPGARPGIVEAVLAGDQIGTRLICVGQAILSPACPPHRPRILPIRSDKLSVSRFAEHALRILDAAESASNQGERCSEMTILIGQDGAIRMLADSDWPLDSLASHHGAQTAYRVTERDGTVRVEGREGSRTCVLESAKPSHTARLLLGPH